MSHPSVKRGHRLADQGLWIAGEEKRAESGERLTIINPATGEELCEVDAAGAADVDWAVHAARSAFDNAWRSAPAAERSRALRQLASLLEESGDMLAELTCLDTGRAISDCEGDVAASLELLHFFAGLPDKLRGETIPTKSGMLTYTVREAYGVIGAIIPWNYPLHTACLKVGASLAAGNCCVLKPAEQAPLVPLELGRIALEAGIPDGVLNVVPGVGERAGAALVAHRGVDKITFTGSSEVGKSVMAAAATRLTPVTLELGGKSPIVVFEDSDLESAANAAAFSVFFNQGQSCTAATRLIVARSIADDFVNAVAVRAAAVRVGDPFDRRNHVGAVISADQFQQIQQHLAQAEHDNARLVFKGDSPIPERGFFMNPVILEADPSMGCAKEEIFGPVLTVLRFDTEREAIELANAVDYGLAASVWTEDAARMQRLAQQLDAGVFWGNCIFVDDPAAPMGGFKHSGFGKDYGLEAGMEYTRLKTVWLQHGPRKVPWDFASD